MKKYSWLEKILSDVKEDEKEAWEAISQLETFMMFYDFKSLDQEAERDYQEQKLTHHLGNIDLKIQFALEKMGLLKFLERYLSGFKKYTSNLDNIEMNSLGDYPFSPALEYQRDFISILNNFSSSNHTNPLISLERVLYGTPKIIKDHGLKPSNEAEVKRVLYSHLIHIFPDTVREIPISKVTKAYRPDFGVKSLMATIEYKFVDNEGEAGKTLGQIYEDIHGYAGSKDWKTFYAVIYMTDAFYTLDQVKAEFDMAKVNNSWVPILVTGKGERRIRKNKVKTQKSRITQTKLSKR
jgi:hypothetical protein